MSKSQYFFLDGYNIINSWKELKLLKDSSFSEARYKLIDMLQDFSAYRGAKVAVIFDAHYVKGSIEKHETVGNIEVVYTKEGESADCYIERTVARISKHFEVSVVTYDHIEQSVVLQMGGLRITPLEFLDEVKKSKKQIKEDTQLKVNINKNTLENHVDKNTLEKLEKMRRNL